MQAANEELRRQIDAADEMMAALRVRVAEARASGDGKVLQDLLHEATYTAAMLQTLHTIQRDLNELNALAEGAEPRNLEVRRAA